MSDEQGESYTREHAAFYDVHVGAADRADVDYYRERAAAATGPVLELACGTGRIYREVLAAGVDADGIDVSADALAVLRERCAEAGLEPSVWQADMTEFAVDREYALVYCPFNALQHLLTVEDRLAAFARAYDALAPGGAFVFDVFVPDFELIAEEYDEWRRRTVEYRGEPHEYHERSRLVDPVEGEFLVENRLYDPDDELVFDVEHRLSMLTKPELEGLARESPFDRWSVTGDFTDEPIGPDHSVQVWRLERPAGPGYH